MKRLWGAAFLLAGGLMGGCSDNEADPAIEAEPENDLVATADETVTSLSPEEFETRFPEAKSVPLAELEEVESIELHGGMLQTHEELRLIPHDLTIDDEQVVGRIVEILQGAEVSGGASAGETIDIGPNLLLVVKGNEQFSGPYAFFLNEAYQAIEVPNDSRERRLLTNDNMNKLKELIYSALEEKIGETAGISIFAAPAFISAGVSEMMLTVNNERAAAFEVQEIQFKKMDEGTREWVTYPSEEENVLRAEGLSCPAFETCEWQLDLSAVSDEWPVGWYAGYIGDLVFTFSVE